MTTFHSAAQLAESQRKRAQRVRRSLEIASKSVADEMKQEATRLVSGSVSSATLAALGHPFGRRRHASLRRGGMRGNLPRLPINVQTGRLRRSLRVFRKTRQDGIVWQLQFTAPEASFVLAPGGTRTMVARSFWAAMKKNYNSKARRLYMRALRMANK